MITADITIDLTGGYDVKCIPRRDGNVAVIISVSECDVTLVVKPDTLIGDAIIQSMPKDE